MIILEDFEDFFRSKVLKIFSLTACIHYSNTARTHIHTHTQKLFIIYFNKINASALSLQGLKISVVWKVDYSKYRAQLQNGYVAVSRPDILVKMSFPYLLFYELRLPNLS